MKNLVASLIALLFVATNSLCFATTGAVVPPPASQNPSMLNKTTSLKPKPVASKKPVTTAKKPTGNKKNRSVVAKGIPSAKSTTKTVQAPSTSSKQAVPVAKSSSTSASPASGSTNSSSAPSSSASASSLGSNSAAISMKLSSAASSAPPSSSKPSLTSASNSSTNSSLNMAPSANTSFGAAPPPPVVAPPTQKSGGGLSSVDGTDTGSSMFSNISANDSAAAAPPAPKLTGNNGAGTNISQPASNGGGVVPGTSQLPAGNAPPADSSDRAMNVVAQPPAVQPVNHSQPLPQKVTSDLSPGLVDHFQPSGPPPSSGVPGTTTNFSSGGNANGF